MPKIQANGIEIEYETSGDPRGTPALLIMGLGAQLTRWPEGFCRALEEGGHHVIRFDNRDIGLSTKVEQAGRPRMGRVALGAALGRTPRPPYTLDDMAADAVGLLDALGLGRAHVIGASMGGMIAQILAARHSARVRSLVSVMSTSGDRRLPGPPWALRLQLVRRVSRRDREARIRHTTEVLRAIGSKTYPRDAAELRAQVARDLDRSDDAFGTMRQLWAIVGSGSRLDLLPRIQAPTLIVHGVEDSLVPVAAAHDLHRRIRHAHLEVVPGMGHDLPAPLLPRITARILAHLQAADRGGGAR